MRRHVAQTLRPRQEKALALRRYFEEMKSVLEEMKRVLKSDKPAVIVVGSSRIKGLDVETHSGLVAIGESVGFNLAGIGTRRLDRDKRMMQRDGVAKDTRRSRSACTKSM